MSDELKPVIEALIFASPDPLTPKMLFKLLESEPKEDVEAALEALKRDYERPGGLQLVEVAGGYQIVTKPELHEWVRRLFHERTTQRLSVQALETLAVIAYKQPITAPEITEIRGVNTAGVINTLIERQLVKIVGRKQVVGRPFMYATTREFLIRFGLRDLTDLPKIEEMAEALGFDVPAGLTQATPPQAQLDLLGGAAALDEMREVQEESLNDHQAYRSTLIRETQRPAVCNLRTCLRRHLLADRDGWWVCLRHRRSCRYGCDHGRGSGCRLSDFLWPLGVCDYACRRVAVQRRGRRRWRR